MRVADVMMKNPLTVSPSDTVGQTDELMYENQYRQLPVVINNQLVGIITDRDIRSFPSDSSDGGQKRSGVCRWSRRDRLSVS